MTACLLPVAQVIVLAMGLGAASVLQAQAIQRCESKDGRITYSNAACPEGTVATRKVNTEPPVSVDDRKSAQERNRRDAAAARQIDKEQAQQEARARREAADLAKADAKVQARCDNARRDLDKARAARGEMNARAYPADKLQRADLEIGRREAEVERECPR